MKLKKLGLTNYCQFANKQHIFSEGMTMLSGKCGSGKSNFMNAIYFALTGKSMLEKKNRKDMLQWETDKGFVDLTFDHLNTEYVIRRGLHSASAKLTTSEGLSLNKSSEINNHLEGILKADAAQLLSTCFMAQNDTAELIFGTDTNRQAAFSKLWQLTHLAKYRELIRTYSTNIIEYPDTTEEQVNLARQVEDLDKDIKILSEKSKQCDKYLTDNNAKYLLMLSEKALMSMADKKAKIQTNQILVNNSQTKLAKEEASLKELGAEVIISPEEIQMYNTYMQLQQDTKDLLALQPILANFPELPPYEQEKVLQEYNLNDLKQQYNTAVNLLAGYKSGLCPTCGTILSKGVTAEAIALEEDKVAKLKLKIKELEDISAEVNRRLQYERTRSDHQENNAKLADAVLKGNTACSNFILADYLTKQAAATKYVNDLDSRKIILANIDKIKLELQNHVTDLNTWKNTPCQSFNYDPEYLTKYESLSSQQTGFAIEINRLTTEQASLIKQRERAVQQNISTKKAREDKAYLETMRSILHSDQYPKQVSSLYKEKLEEFINKYLENFDQSFIISISDDMDFLCDFPTQLGTSPTGLSGGQKGMLMVAVRLAVAELLSKDIEILTFDEPGAAMDAEAKEGLVEAFNKIRGYLSTKKIQIVLASHDSNMIAATDAVISL